MTLNESQLKEVISQCICEAFDGFGGLAEFFNNGEFSEEKTKDSKEDKKDSKKKSNNTDKSEEENSKKEKGSNAKRAQIEDFFDKPGVNNAQYAYKLYGVKPVEGKDTLEMKNARSQFQKDLHHDLNDSGYPYEFTPQELNRLQSMISNNQLSEAVDKAIKNVLKESDEDYGKMAVAISNKMGKEKGKVIVHNGQTIYIWKEPNGDYAASSQNPKENYIDANRIARFPKASGFLNINDVEDYIKRYFK